MKRTKVKKTLKQKKVKPVKIKPIKAKVVSDDTSLKSRVMTCIVTGLSRRVSKAGMAKGIKKFGGIIQFTDHYVSNEAKRLLKQRVSPEEVQKQLRPANLKPFSIDKQILGRLKLLKKARHKKLTEQEATMTVKNWKPAERRFYSTIQEYVVDNTRNGSCIAPQLYLNSDRVCDQCKYTKFCLSTAKQFSKKYKPQ
jgi:hypothetical protein